MAQWQPNAGTWWCSSCSACNWASRASCRACTNRKSYAQAIKLGKRTPQPAKPTATPPRAPPVEAPSGDPPTISELRSKLASLKAAKEACLAAGSTATQSIEMEISATTRLLHGSKPAGEQMDGLRAALARAEKRMQKATQDLDDAQTRVEQEADTIDAYKRDLAELERNLAGPAVPSDEGRPPQAPPWMARSLQEAAEQVRAGRDMTREALADYLEGLAQPRGPDPEPWQHAQNAQQLLEQAQPPGGADMDMDSETPQMPVQQGQQVLANVTNRVVNNPNGNRRANAKTYVETPQLAQLA